MSLKLPERVLILMCVAQEDRDRAARIIDDRYGRQLDDIFRLELEAWVASRLVTLSQPGPEALSH